MRATSEADIFVFFCTDLIGREMWHSVLTLETGSSGRASRLTHKPIHRSIRSSSAGGVQSHLTDLQSSAADRWLQAVIKREDMDLCPQYTARAERKQAQHRRHSWNPSCHIFKLTVSGFTVSTGTEHTHILLCSECIPSLWPSRCSVWTQETHAWDCMYNFKKWKECQAHPRSIY